MCIYGITNCKYQFSHTKYEAKNVFLARLVPNTIFDTQNINPGIYLRPGQLYIAVS